MKNHPGIRLAGFLSLVIVVAAGVYAWGEEKAAPSKQHPKFILKLGWEGATPEQSEPLNISLERFKRVLKLLHITDPKQYKIRHYHADGTVSDEGELQTCLEPEPVMMEARTSPTPTPTPRPGPTKGPAGTPPRNKTQLTAVIALGKPRDAQIFFRELNKK